MQSREQIYATKVYGRVIYDNRNNVEYIDEAYKNLALRFPALLLSAGLTHSMGYLVNDMSGAGGKYLRDIVALVRDAQIAGFHALPGDNAVCSFTRSLSVEQYMYLTQEALAVATWIKKYCS